MDQIENQKHIQKHIDMSEGHFIKHGKKHIIPYSIIDINEYERDKKISDEKFEYFDIILVPVIGFKPFSDNEVLEVFFAKKFTNDTLNTMNFKKKPHWLYIFKREEVEENIWELAKYLGIKEKIIS